MQSEEIKSILQFMYLGQATVNQDRMGEFLDVAKSLEIEISNDVKKDADEAQEIDEQIQLKNDNLNDIDSYLSQISDTQMARYDNTNEFDNQELKENMQLNIEDPDPYMIQSINVPAEIEKDSKSYIRNEAGTHQCKKCKKQYTTKGYLSIHMKTIHEGLKIKIPCDLCDKVSSSNAGHSYHKRTVHEGRKYPCNKCNLSYKLKSNLSIHFKTVHEGLKYPCDLCDWVFSSTKTLLCHKQSIHEGIKYHCNICNLSYTKKYNLKLHKRAVHESIKLICD